MIAFLLLMIAYALLNRARGSAVLPKVVCYALFGVLLCVNAYMHEADLGALGYLVLLLGGFAGSYWGFAHCWGKYFPQPLDTSAEVCVRLVNSITDRLYGPYTSTTPIPQALNWKTIAMGFRFLLFFWPKYAFVALWFMLCGYPAEHMLLMFLFSLPMLLFVGVIYRFWFDVCARVPAWNAYNVRNSELTTGAWFCIIDAMMV